MSTHEVCTLLHTEAAVLLRKAIDADRNYHAEPESDPDMVCVYAALDALYEELTDDEYDIVADEYGWGQR